ncbi:MAG: family 43 glycosylhydrolase [Sedimentisphaerales bacterium]|nr:family 43 glycosylhydrolase [Sedimentisphaerales bacterium]
MLNKKIVSAFIAAMAMLQISGYSDRVELRVDAGKAAHEMSDTMYGLFFEDINFAADGGLYADQIWNRSFEFDDGMFSWDVKVADEARAEFALKNDKPLNANNPNYLNIAVVKAGEVSLSTAGFGGIAVEAGKKYNVSFYARSEDYKGKVAVQLQDAEGAELGTVMVSVNANQWTRYEVAIKSKATSAKARLALKFSGTGSLDLDMISLMPEDTWKKQPEGLRADLVQILAEMKPGFLRFPGGCIVEGKDLANAYRWKDTIGDPAERKLNWNRWAGWNNPPQYYQSYGLGFYEYFRLCEEIGAEPVPILNCGMSCQYQDAQLVPLDELEPYVQDMLDLIEYANGPADSTWGAKRAAAGHPEPFGLKLLGVGNEQWGEQYFERYNIFYKRLKEKHPEITIVTTSGPSANGKWYDLAWDKFNSGKSPADIVDEHYYMSPAWFLANTQRYDNYPRNGIEVFAGEYAAHTDGRRNDLHCALAEAAFMTGLERNGDIVTMAAYAPMLARDGYTQWAPDLIWFDATRVYGSPSYYVQKMFSLNKGSHYLPNTVTGMPDEVVPAGKIGLCTWNTDAQYKDLVVSREGEVLFTMAGLDGWKVKDGKWQFKDGSMHQSDSNIGGALCTAGNAQWSDYTLSLKARKNAGREGFIIVFRTDEKGDGLQWNLGGWNNVNHAIQRNVGGSSSVIVEKPGKIDSDRWYDIKIELKGTQVTCMLDGEIVHQLDVPVIAGPQIFASSTIDSATGQIMLKVVNVSEKAQPVDIVLDGIKQVKPEAQVETLTGASLAAVNALDNPTNVAPFVSVFNKAASEFSYIFKPRSVTVIRLQQVDRPEPVTSADDKAYIFSYFKDNGQDGLHLAYSYDGLTWAVLKNDTSFLIPEIGSKLMRDPSVVQGPDGMFHMVWTTGWHDNGIGLAHSTDLVNWSQQQFLPVMAHEPTAKNCWAPEIFYDDVTQTYIIYWATTIPGRFPKTDNPKDDNNHRMYCIKTRDFKEFTPTELFFDPGFNVIDAFIAKDQASGKYAMVVKNETKHPKAQKNLSITMADKAAGPYGKVSKPITGKYWAEGPSLLRVDNLWYIYFDKYTEGKYGAICSPDLKKWTDVSNQISLPAGLRHGTAFTVDRALLDKLR